MSKNKIVFPFIVVSAYILSLIESFSYIGFLKKYIFVDSRYFLVLGILFLLLLKVGGTKKVDFWIMLDRLVLQINRFLFPIFLIIYFSMQVTETLKFHNYVYTTFHIQPGNFIYVLIFSFGLFILDKTNFRKIKISLINLCLMFVVVFVLIDNLAITLNQVFYTDMYIMFHLRNSYDQKMENYWGFYYNYIAFVKANTPENSTIIIPPQEMPWLSTGNGALDEYFLYPRKIVQGGFDKSLEKKSADFALFAWGEWKGADPAKYGWPKTNIKADEITYFNGNKNWGIIKIRK